jgi:hypothetical protein
MRSMEWSLKELLEPCEPYEPREREAPAVNPQAHNGSLMTNRFPEQNSLSSSLSSDLISSIPSAFQYLTSPLLLRSSALDAHRVTSGQGSTSLKPMNPTTPVADSDIEMAFDAFVNDDYAAPIQCEDDAPPQSEGNNFISPSNADNTPCLEGKALFFPIDADNAFLRSPLVILPYSSLTYVQVS